jgi:hypothetical protein
MTYKPLLESLAQLLKSRLEFRRGYLIESINEVRSQFLKAGQNGGSRMALFIAQAYEREALARAELIVTSLHQARLSWSPRHLVEGQDDLRTTISELFKDNLSQAARLAQDMCGNRGLDAPGPQNPVTVFLANTDQGSRSAVAIVEAVIKEVAAAAANDMAAQTSMERPTYVHQTFHGPVGSVASGAASVGPVSQTIVSATPLEIANAVTAILQAMPSEASTAEALQAKEQLKAAETELRAGKVPFGALGRALNLLGKAEDIALRVPELAQYIGTLARMVGFG